MGTKKGQVRKTARRAYEPKKKDRDFVDFIKHTLVPDLEESGKKYTAMDMKKLVKIIEKLWGGK